METIQLYFKNENDAESVRAKLNTIKTKNLMIEEMPHDTDSTLFVPFLSTNISSTNLYGGSALGYTGTFAPGFINEDGDNDSSDSGITHLLRVDIEKKDYEKVTDIAKQYDCYVMNLSNKK